MFRPSRGFRGRIEEKRMAAKQVNDWVKSHLIGGIARVDLRIRDLDRGLAFYRDILGLEVAERDGSRATLRSPGSDGFLRLQSRGVSAPSDPTAIGLFHTAFRYPTRADLGDVLARLLAADYEVGAGDHLVSEALYVDDPDGNGVELYWDRPVEEWPTSTEDMPVPMATLAVDLPDLLAAGRSDAAVGAPSPRGTDIGHVHLQVSDIDAAVRFYLTELGLDLTARLGRSAAFFSSYGYHHNIGANTWRSRGSKLPGREHAGLERVVFNVPDGKELNRLRERLRAKVGNESAAEREPVVVADPDGIELQFITS
jgi:catechol 2,3-dioxygenase